MTLNVTIVTEYSATIITSWWLSNECYVYVRNRHSLVVLTGHLLLRSSSLWPNVLSLRCNVYLFKAVYIASHIGAVCVWYLTFGLELATITSVWRSVQRVLVYVMLCQVVLVWDVLPNSRICSFFVFFFSDVLSNCTCVCCYHVAI